MIKLLYDLASLCGAASVVYGVWLMSPPIAWVVGGLVVTALAVLRYPVSTSKGRRP